MRTKIPLLLTTAAANTNNRLFRASRPISSISNAMTYCSSSAAASNSCEPLSSDNSSSSSSRESILAKSWTIVASGYNQTFVSKFSAWTDDALRALETTTTTLITKNDDDAATDGNGCSSNGSPQQKALVLCCGPGQELMPVAKILGPTAKVIGIDLAPGMVDLARRRVQEECRQDNYSNNISVQVGDAMNPPLDDGPYNVIFSAFGLQQLPKPLDALQGWIKVLEPGGVGAVIYWPPDAPSIPGEEEDGPFERWGDLLNEKLAKDGDASTKDATTPWDANIGAAAEEAGANILQNVYIVHPISWESPKDLFDCMSRAGPWHAMRLRRGDNFVDELGEELQAAYPANEPLTHRFTARMLVLRRR